MKKGFTIIELISVVIVMGIITAISITGVKALIDRTKIEVDSTNIKKLNKATGYYVFSEDITGDAFAGIDVDEERIDYLFTLGYLEKTAIPQMEDEEYIWKVDSQTWVYSYYENSSQGAANYALPNEDVSEYRSTGTWTNTNDGFESRRGLLFIDNNNEEYTIESSATLDEGNRGGYGILFETSVTEDNKDSGYALQFDRGYGIGSIIIRQRTDGRESGAIRGFVFNERNSFIPNKNTTAGAAWWTDEHRVKLVVTKETATDQKTLAVYIDDRLVFDDFEFESDLAPENNFTGFRSWADTTTYHELDIQ